MAIGKPELQLALAEFREELLIDIRQIIVEEFKGLPKGTTKLAAPFDEEVFRDELLDEIEKIVEVKRKHLYHLMRLFLDRGLTELYKALDDEEYVPLFISNPSPSVPHEILAQSRGKQIPPQLKEAFCPGCGYQYIDDTESSCKLCGRQRQELGNGTPGIQQPTTTPAPFKI